VAGRRAVAQRDRVVAALVVLASRQQAYPTAEGIVPMRTARTLVAGAALTACLAVAAPAYATGAVNAYDPSSHGSSSTSSSSASTGSSSSSSDNSTGSSSDDSHGWSGQGGSDDSQWHKPHGGLHTGGGGTALESGSGLAAGSFLLLGGLGAGALVLRRRRTAAGAGSLA
jgi:hypothetical protein